MNYKLLLHRLKIQDYQIYFEGFALQQLSMRFLIQALQNRTDCTIQQETIFVGDQIMAMMPEVKPFHPVQSYNSLIHRRQIDQRMFDQPQPARGLNANKHTPNFIIFDSEDLLDSCQEFQMFNIKNSPYFQPEKQQPFNFTPIDVDEFIIGDQKLSVSQPKPQSRKSNKRKNYKSQTNVELEKTQTTKSSDVQKKGQSGPFQARFTRKIYNKVILSDTDEKCEMKNQAQNENHVEEKTDINLQLVQRIRCCRKDRRFNYLQLNLIAFNPKFLKFLHEVGNQQFQGLHNVISKEQASKEQLDKAILKMNYLRVFFGWGNIFKFYPGFTEKRNQMVVISALKKCLKLFDVRIYNMEHYNQTTTKSYQISKEVLVKEKPVDEEKEVLVAGQPVDEKKEKVQASKNSQEQNHKYDIPKELQKPRECFAKLCKQDYQMNDDAQNRSYFIESLKKDREIIFQIIKRLGDKDTKSQKSQEAQKKQFDPSSNFYFSQIEKWYIENGKLITEGKLKDLEGEMDSETIGDFFQRNKTMVQICSLIYFIINAERKGKPSKAEIEEKVGPLNGEEQKPEAQLRKKERKKKTITKEPKTKNIKSESKNLVKSIPSRKPKKVQEYVIDSSFLQSPP